MKTLSKPVREPAGINITPGKVRQHVPPSIKAPTDYSPFQTRHGPLACLRHIGCCIAAFPHTSRSTRCRDIGCCHKCPDNEPTKCNRHRALPVCRESCGSFAEVCLPAQPFDPHHESPYFFRIKRRSVQYLAVGSVGSSHSRAGTERAGGSVGSSHSRA